MSEQNTPSYELTYLRQLLSEEEIEPPDLTQCNGFRDIIEMLYGQHQVGGSDQVAHAITTLWANGLPSTSAFETQTLKRISWKQVAYELPTVEWLIENEIPKNGITVVYGDSNIGKSYLCLDYAVRISLEQDACVAYVAGEGNYGYSTRLQAWMDFHGKDNCKLEFVNQAVNLFDNESVDEFIALYRGEKLALAIIDTLSTCTTSADENSSKDMGIVYANCKRIIDAVDTAVLLVHHTTKEKKSYRGSSVIFNNADSVIEIKKAGKGITKACEKARYCPIWEPQHFSFKLIELENGMSDQVIAPSESEKPQKKTDQLTEQEIVVLKGIGRIWNGSGRIPTLKEIYDALDSPKFTINTLRATIFSDLKKKKYLEHQNRKNYLSKKAIEFLKEQDIIVTDHQNDVMMIGHNLSSSCHTPLRGYDGDGYDDSIMTDEAVEEVSKPVPHLNEEPEPIWIPGFDDYDDYIEPPEMTKERFEEDLKFMPPMRPMTEEELQKDYQEYLIEMEAMEWYDERLYYAD